ncbi:MAG: sulfur carrier protein ThiS [Phycisphaerales bacterium]|nr:sulfur carrier protein ThiS [Phycisphaerales bacterium]
MRITVNAEPRDVPDHLTLEALIRDLELHKAPCAAEVNRTLIPKKRHPEHELREGDTVELVTLVGGG